MELDLKTQSAVGVVGELLIRAAATLATLSPEQLERLSEVTEGCLPGGLDDALTAAGMVSPSVAESLKTHPPKRAA